MQTLKEESKSKKEENPKLRHDWLLDVEKN